MNYFNHQNVQLAYEAVYNQDLCESMEELGLINDYDAIDEGKRINTTPADIRIRERQKRDVGTFEGKFTPSMSEFLKIERNRRAAHQASRGVKKVKGVKEEVDLYDIILEYLIQEGYADTLGSAEIILENMSEDWLEEILDEAREEGVKPYRANPTQADIRERQKKSKKTDDRSGWKDRSHIKSEGPLITAKPGDKEEAKKALKQTLPDDKRIMGPGFFPSRTADRVASITSSFTRGDKPGGGDPRATRLPKEEAPKPRRVIPSRLDRKK